MISKCGIQLDALIMALILLCIGGVFLYLIRAGKINSIRVSGALFVGGRARLISTVFAGLILSLGSVVLLSSIFGWGCPGR